MKGRWIISVIFLLPAGGAGYMTWLSGQAGDDGKWLFGVFTLFFLLLAAAPFAPKFKRQSKPEPPPTTRFVPHWFMLLAILVIVLSMIAAIVGAFQSL